MNEPNAPRGSLNTNENRNWDDPMYYYTPLPEGAQIPEYERLELTTEYILRLLAAVPVKTREAIESLWPKIQEWNETVTKYPYRNEDELRGVFEILVKVPEVPTAHHTEPHPLRVWSIGEILTHDFGVEEWIVKSLITKQGITALSGNPGDFKTWVTIHIALCVARSALVFGKFATTQGGVLIIDEEDHLRVIKGRLELLGAKDTDTIHYLSQSGFKADNEKALEAVVEFVKEKNIRLVILDSLVRVHSQEENDASGMSKVFACIQKIIGAGASILFTHHHRKQQGFGGNSNPGQNMRGSSDILAAVDSHITIEKKRDEDGYLVIKQTKLRQDEVLKPFEVSILKGPKGPSGFEYTGDHDERKNKAEEAAEALDLLLAEGMKSRPEIHEALTDEFGKTAIDDAIKMRKEAGTIEKVAPEELPKEDRRKAYYRRPISQPLLEIEKQEDDVDEEDTEEDYEEDN